jgi:diguanylate cyclase (GGDEF)-like protein
MDSKPSRGLRAFRYAAWSAILALGAPLGWMAIRSLSHEWGRHSVWQEVSSHWQLYSYLLFATVVVFAAFGAWVGRLADRLIEANLALEDLVATDVTTSLRNARYFRDRLRTECARANRERTPLSLIVADLDFFKQVNDRYGHAVGDEVLAHAARTIASSIREGDVACRIGGEEFAILCPGAGVEEGRRVAERIRAHVQSHPFLSIPTSVAVTVSVGVAGFEFGQSASALFRAADSALYTAKAKGRNRVEEPIPGSSAETEALTA